MKNVVLTFVFIIGIYNFSYSQDISENAIGIRFGDNNGFGGEISYQKRMAEFNRLELDLGYRKRKNYDAFKLSGIYQWVWNIDHGFNWYVGFGGGLVAYIGISFVLAVVFAI